MEVNDGVTERSGVPEALRDKYWWTFRGSDVGLLGTTAQLGIPSDEEILDAADGLVVSVTGGRDDEQELELVVRDFATGSTLRKMTLDFVAPVAKLVGRRLFWTGLRGACDEERADGGVWAVDVDANTDPVAIVKPGHILGCGMTWRALELSPSGETLGGMVSSYGDPNWVDVIDVDTLERRNRLRDVWPWAITDDTFLQWDHKFTDGLATGMGGISAYDLSTGALRWRFPGAGELDRFAPFGQMRAVDSHFLVEYSWSNRSGTDLVLALFDPFAGARSILLRQDVPSGNDVHAALRPEMSAASHLVLEGGYGPTDAGPRRLAVLDVAAGTVDWDAISIDPPWLCFPDHCFRD